MNNGVIRKYLLWYGRLNPFINLCQAIIGYVIFVYHSVRSSTWNNSAQLETF